jgi:hypothetical protein
MSRQLLLEVAHDAALDLAAKQSVTWKFSAGCQRASGTPDCSVASSSAISSGTGRATNRRGIVVEVLGHEGRALRRRLDALGLGWMPSPG